MFSRKTPCSCLLPYSVGKLYLLHKWNWYDTNKILALNCMTSFIEETSGPNTLSQNESYFLYHELLFWILSLFFTFTFTGRTSKNMLTRATFTTWLFQMFTVNVFQPMEYQSLTYPFLQMFCSVDVSRSKEAHSFKCSVVWMFHAPKRHKTWKSFGPSARCQPPLTHGPQSLRASPIVFERAH